MIRYEDSTAYYGFELINDGVFQRRKGGDNDLPTSAVATCVNAAVEIHLLHLRSPFW